MMVAVTFFSLGSVYGVNKSEIEHLSLDTNEITQNLETDLYEQPQEENIVLVEDIQDNKEGYGIITGSLSYPSHSIPALIICAENIITNQTYCTKRNIPTSNGGKDYRLQVPEGFYEVYAGLTSPEHDGQVPENRVYFSDEVICGLYYGCPSSDPIVIRVSSQEIRTDIDPTDWY
ncbi:MAG: hypothetical protein QG639_943 [Patescibacteria group bacterium]|nr:hypothetical protein [Patescibacteria group bacterium]